MLVLRGKGRENLALRDVKGPRVSYLAQLAVLGIRTQWLRGLFIEVTHERVVVLVIEWLLFIFIFQVELIGEVLHLTVRLVIHIFRPLHR